jgi:4-amino-4-deoxy-L-arabinose transferase-like glycosyltransferase
MTTMPTPPYPDHHALNHRRALWIGWASLLLAVFVYCTGLGSDHLATNGDELLYAQISKLTAAGGEWLPLRSLDDRLRNTKPPMLFWQGIVSTEWGYHWSLSLLRAPNVLYTLLTAGLLILIGWKRTRSMQLGLTAALLFLCFFSTYRYGRVFLTSAPETFWLFAPLALLLLHREPRFPSGMLWPWICGGMIGVGLLYKSFALVIPVSLTMALWQLRARGWCLRSFIREDLWRIALIVISALLLFSLWFWLDPHPVLVLKDFVLRENAGKFDTGGENYFLNLICGQSSVWRIVVSYPLNAGLLGLLTVALFWDAWRRRHHLGQLEVFLWIWMLVLAAFFCIPNQRDERYLIPAMPALALLMAIRLGHFPRWIVTVTLAAAGIVLVGLPFLALLLQHAAGIPLYPSWFLFPLALALGTVAFALVRKQFARTLIPASVLCVYLGYYLFLIPLDQGPGLFKGEGVESVNGCEVSVPSNFNAREESYGFLLPGSKVTPYDHRSTPPKTQFVVISLPLDQAPPEGVILGKRLNMIDRFNAEETRDILLGNVTRQLFRWDWLVQRN